MNDKQKILIVDDKKENLVALQWVLREVDAEIVEATSGNEALAATLNHKFSVAILDVQMPGMSGYELAENLRGEEKTRMIPIVFITAAYADEAHKFMGYEAGGVDYLTKPYSPEVLLGKIKIFLEIDRNRQELEIYRNHLEALVTERTMQLNERIKELHCLYAISSLGQESSKSINDTLQDAVLLIPQGWQYPEITCVRIVFKGQAFASTTFRDTTWKQSADIVISGETVGTLELCYLEERTTLYEGPFLKEEIDLLNALAKKLGFLIERVQVGNLEMLAREMLEILNRPNNITVMIKDILQLLQKSMDFGAVGVRLKEGDDFPYYETSGFSEDFVRSEKYLCLYNEEGNIVRDSKGNSLLECMCGNILREETDATLPFFTNKGSFWTNSTTNLLATTTEKDRQASTRNRCNGEGYESVALIPLRNGDEIIGLMQLNDCRRNQFSRKIVESLEDLGSSIGIALSRKRAKDELQSLSHKNQLILSSAAEGIMGLDLQGNHSFLNAAAAHMLGYEAEELLGRPSHSVWHHTKPDGSPYPEKECMIHAGYREEVVHRVSTEVFWRKDGTSFPVEYASTPLNEYNQSVGTVITFTDITERKQAEETLIRSEAKFRNYIEHAPDGVFILDNTGRYLEANNAACLITGYSKEEIEKMSIRDLLAEESLEDGLDHFKKLMETGAAMSDLWHTHKDGSKRCLTINAVKLSGTQILGFCKDITERKQTVEQIFRKSRLVTSINSIFLQTLTADSEETVAKTCLEAAQEITDSKFGIIGEVTPEGLFTATYLSDPGWEACRIPDTKASMLLKDMVIRGIWGQVILEEQSLIVNNPLSYPDRVGIPKGHPPLISFLGVPLKDRGKVIGMIALANNASGYTVEHKQDMEALSIAFVEALRRKQAEEKLLKTLDSLKEAASTTIHVLASTVESRDPYTAGHQIKTAELARAIATEIGLPQEKIDGLYMAGSIHDIGKISIPAEILSKPGKLSTIEFLLIKEHANRGYEMLKDVESQWPLAEIVRQHHERMDGSGYPRNLKGDEILIEARILTVADTIEAMASHRPYRPGLGIDSALEEIEKNKGIFYDNAVADACLKLFREKGYQLE